MNFGDEVLVTKAVNDKAHQGYQMWHRDMENEVTRWLDDEVDATPAQFEEYLRNLYATHPDLAWRFPGRTKLVYYHVRPERFGTQVDLTRSRILRREPISCEKCKYGGLTKGIRSVVIDESSWTGEDMFFAWGLPGLIIVSDRVRQLRDEHGLTNMHIIPVEEYDWDPYRRLHLWDERS